MHFNLHINLHHTLCTHCVCAPSVQDKAFVSIPSLLCDILTGLKKLAQTALNRSLGLPVCCFSAPSFPYFLRPRPRP